MGSVLGGPKTQGRPLQPTPRGPAWPPPLELPADPQVMSRVEREMTYEQARLAAWNKEGGYSNTVARTFRLGAPRLTPPGERHLHLGVLEGSVPGDTGQQVSGMLRSSTMASFMLSCLEIMGCMCAMQVEAARSTGGMRVSTAPSLQFGSALEGGGDAPPDPQQPQQLTRMLTVGMTVREKVVEVVGRANAKVQMCNALRGLCAYLLPRYPCLSHLIPDHSLLPYPLCCLAPPICPTPSAALHPCSFLRWTTSRCSMSTLTTYSRSYRRSLDTVKLQSPSR